MVPGDPALGGGALESCCAVHVVASGSYPYQVADVENQTYQHVPDVDSAARVTAPDPSGPSPTPLVATWATAPLTCEGAVEEPVVTPY